uniref:Peptidase A2 domain-containing protein n=1 Tax=Vitis vinifera TaxID=29760 RepID=A5BNI4_VITVI|nr:hypothetical protein VITISV_031777 [Vitis vinifera]
MHCYAKYFPPAYKDRPSHGFIAYLPTLLAISRTCPKLSWDNTYNESLREFVKLFDQAVLQQVLVAGRPSKSNMERNTKPLDRPKPSDRRQEGLSRPEMPPLTPLSISYEKLLPMIQGVRLQAKEAKIVAGRINTRTHQFHPAWANRRGPRPIDGTIIFPPVDPTRTLQPHRDALILSLEIGDFDVRRILVDPGSSADLVQASVVGHMGHSLTGLENPGRILSRFNGSSTTSLGDIVLPVQTGPVTLNVQFSVVQELSPFNVILGRTWLHYMKAIPSTYHQMVSFLTNDGQIDLHGSQLATRQCYQITREAGANQEDASPPEPSLHMTNSNYWWWYPKKKENGEFV